MSDDMLSEAAIAPFSTLLKRSKDCTEIVHETLALRSGVLQGQTGPLGVAVKVGKRQSLFWLVSDHPRYEELHAFVENASKSGKPQRVEIDSENNVLLNASSYVGP